MSHVLLTANVMSGVICRAPKGPTLAMTRPKRVTRATTTTVPTVAIAEAVAMPDRVPRAAIEATVHALQEMLMRRTPGPATPTITPEGTGRAVCV